MALTIRFPEAPPVPKRLPLLVARRPAWDDDAVSHLSGALGVDGERSDAGGRLVVAGSTATLEVFRASSSVRYMRTDVDGEGRDLGAVRVTADQAVEVAEQFLERLGRPDADVRERRVTEQEVLRTGPEGRSPSATIVALQVNYAFALEGISLVGPGAKVQVGVAGEGEVVSAYRFWRDTVPTGDVASVAPATAFRRFSAARLFAGLDDRTASVEMESVELGLYCSPPSEPQAVLLPAYVFRGRLSTALLADYRFVSYLAAGTVTGPGLKELGVPHARPAVFAA